MIYAMLTQRVRVANLTSCHFKNQIDVSFYKSVQLLPMNFDKVAVNAHELLSIDNFMTKFMINNRMDP